MADRSTMKQPHLMIATFCIGATLTLASCIKEVMNEEEAEVPTLEQTTNSRLVVKAPTMLAEGAETGDAQVSYPIQIYIFNQENSCVATSTIATAEESLNIPLLEGTYQVDAVGGASSSHFSLPTQEEATPQSELILKQGGSMPDLMAASHAITLVKGGTNQLALAMKRKVMLLEEVNIIRVPDDIKAVSVTLVPLYQHLLLDGSYSNTTESQTIELADEDGDGQWESTEQIYLLPASQDDATITVNMTDEDDAVTSYSYSTRQSLTANYKIRINGTYTGPHGITLTGTITGATWGGTHDIEFEFDQNGSTDKLATGNIYKKCYVLNTENDETETKYRLFSLKATECNSTITDEISPLLLEIKNEVGIDEGNTWGVLRTTDTPYIEANLDAINEILTAEGAIPFSEGSYWMVFSSGYKFYQVSDGKFVPSNATSGYVRGFTTLTRSLP